jgi:hypothetical protein
MVIVGTGDYPYQALAAWQQLPAGVNLIETPGVAVGTRDRVYALTRNTAHPVIVLEPDGTCVSSFGQGVFSERTHGILAGPDGSIYCADDGTHTMAENGHGRLSIAVVADVDRALARPEPVTAAWAAR